LGGLRPAFATKMNRERPPLGCRAGELAGLQWGDLDFNVKFPLNRRGSGKLGTKTKTGKIRRVDASDELLNELDRIRPQRQAQYLAKGQNQIPEWVFCNREGNAMDMQNVCNRYFRPTLTKAGLRQRRFHDLRHTFASLLIQNGESLAYVRDQLGHTSIKTTVDIYGHLVPGANRQAVNRLPSLKDLKPKSRATSPAKKSCLESSIVPIENLCRESPSSRVLEF
jgi:integrase